MHHPFLSIGYIFNFRV